MNIPVYRFPDSTLDQLNCSGNNARQVLVLVNSEDIPEHLPLLKKIIRAVGYDFEEDLSYAAIDPHQQMRLLASQDVSEYTKILLFGLDPSMLGIQAKRRTGKSTAEQNPRTDLLRFEHQAVLISPSLSQLEQEPEHKRTLWSRMQEMFNT